MYESARAAAAAAIRPAAVLTAGALLIAGCSAGGSGGPGGIGDRITEVATTAPSPSPSPTAPPYGTSLAEGVGPLNTAIGKLSATAGLDTLGDDLGQAEDAASAASTSLRYAAPPGAVAETNRQLYTALEQLATDLAAVQSDISADKLCAPAAALARTGESQGLKDVRTALQALSTAGYPASFSVPDLGSVQHRALGNGAFIRKGRTGGHGELTVDNSGGSGDAVLTLVKGSETAYSFYVVKGQKAKVKGIRDGAYDVYFTGGSDWDGSTKRFTQDCSFTKFDEGLDFKTTTRTYSIWELTLQAVAGGNASTSDVPADSFPVP